MLSNRFVSSKNFSMFISFMIVILIIGLVSLSIFYQGRNIKHNTEAVFHQTSQKIQLNMDSLILSLDTVSMTSLSSLTVPGVTA